MSTCIEPKCADCGTELEIRWEWFVPNVAATNYYWCPKCEKAANMLAGGIGGLGDGHYS